MISKREQLGISEGGYYIQFRMPFLLPNQKPTMSKHWLHLNNQGNHPLERKTFARCGVGVGPRTWKNFNWLLLTVLNSGWHISHHSCCALSLNSQLSPKKTTRETAVNYQYEFHHTTAEKLTFVTPFIMFSICEHTVLTADNSFVIPNHFSTINWFLPIFLISTLMCRKSRRSVPRGPRTITLRDLTVTSTTAQQ